VYECIDGESFGGEIVEKLKELLAKHRKVNIGRFSGWVGNRLGTYFCNRSFTILNDDRLFDKDVGYKSPMVFIFRGIT
jgi:3-hydroxyacyl-CoA dehydrogenase